MDRQERMNDLLVSQSDAARAIRSEVWTSFPGIVQSFDATKMTAVVQAAIMVRLLQRDGTWVDEKITLLPDCPVQFPGGGGFALTFPLAEGDEVLVVVAKNCIDAWWQQGGVQPQADLRMHDLSDCFCLPLVWSQPRRPVGVSATNVQLRNADSSLLFELTPLGFRFHGPVLFDNDVTVTGALGAGALAATGALTAASAAVAGAIVGGTVHGNAGVSSGADVTSVNHTLNHHVHQTLGGAGTFTTAPSGNS